MTDSRGIDILLATYNGEVFLEAQLNSILKQTHEDWRLIVRDDGSMDGTREILESYRARFPNKVVVVEDREGNLGLVQNFSRLMEHASADYAVFCDQDDVWMPDKLELTLAKMRDLEREHGAHTPLLVFTDLSVVDQDLQVIHPSFWRYQGVRPQRCNTLNRLLLDNVVTGCTAMMNRPLIQKSVPIPPQAIFHDWWVALVAAASGFSGYVARPTVLYRQHGQNLIGARVFTIADLPARIYGVPKNLEKNRKAKLKIFSQGAALLERCADRLPTPVKDRVALFLSLPRRGILSRLFASIRCRCLPRGLWGKASIIVNARGEYK